MVASQSSKGDGDRAKQPISVLEQILPEGRGFQISETLAGVTRSGAAFQNTVTSSEERASAETEGSWRYRTERLPWNGVLRSNPSAFSSRFSVWKWLS